MTRDPDDDDALRWEGDDDPTLAPGWKRVGGPDSEPSTVDAASDGERHAADEPAAPGERPSNATTTAATPDATRQAGSVELIVLGVLGGVYLLYTVGWLLTVIRTDAPGTSIVGDAMYLTGLWLAVLAPALWFGLVFALVSRRALRLVWLAVGAIVLVPLPFVLGVAA
ncbi:DNA polymerase III subunit gamma/tau [Agromyces sp. CFH 90414]|uniref:DNA polymerase III subunit gamma/tau n=1 Tax=Agromyces agglutinans TaxID=2662258 RepID=A0A6I2FCH6_9MICO|nr:DNA polymerase III subunit gamma/tau [Agromyces agglutinans]MRG58828.1 DNA polymerase III subunit gamma/tau [Agromyces agglutinans]